MSQEEHITFERLPGIISDIRKDIKELKVLVIQGQNDSSTGDEWMDVNGLCAYHPDHPAKKTVYDWVTLKRVPYHKDGKRLRFKRSEIDAWLAGHYHRTEDDVLEEAITYMNGIRLGNKY